VQRFVEIVPDREARRCPVHLGFQQQRLVEIVPVRVHGVNQRDFLAPGARFDLFLARNGSKWIARLFEEYQLVAVPDRRSPRHCEP
jgi:hypothetical protein